MLIRPIRVKASSAKELAHKLAELERKIESHDAGIRTLFEAIHRLTTPPAKPRREIGFHVKEDGLRYRVKRKWLLPAISPTNSEF